MTSRPDSPMPEFYLSPGSPVTCLCFLQYSNKDFLLVGLSDGSIIVYDCISWKQIIRKQVFMKGILWMDTISPESIVCQGRFESLKLFSIIVDVHKHGEVHGEVHDDAHGEIIVEKADYLISHEGFCKGFLDTSGKPDVSIIVTPSSTSNLIVSKLSDTFLRPIVTLRPEQTIPAVQFGTVMSCTKFSPHMLLAGYENSDVILWDWKTNTALSRINLPMCGTLMSLTYDEERKYAAVGGSDSTVVVLDCNHQANLRILKERTITNGGVGIVGIRPDKLILVAGGWDNRIRLFSWKYPEKLKPLAVLDFHTQAVECLAFTSRPISSGRTSKKNIFAAGGKDGKLSLWSIY